MPITLVGKHCIGGCSTIRLAPFCQGFHGCRVRAVPLDIGQSRIIGCQFGCQSAADNKEAAASGDQRRPQPPTLGAWGASRSVATESTKPPPWRSYRELTVAALTLCVRVLARSILNAADSTDSEAFLSSGSVRKLGTAEAFHG